MTDYELLLQRARAMRIEVVEVPKSRLQALTGIQEIYACYSPSEERIFILKSMRRRTIGPYVLAHELGHAIDMATNTRHVEMHNRLWRVVNASSIDNPLEEDTAILLREVHLLIEEGAFDQGEQILASLGIQLTQEYFDLREGALASYAQMYG